MISFKKYPFIRILLFLISGMLLQYYFHSGWLLIVGILFTGFSMLFSFVLLPAGQQFFMESFRGILMGLIICGTGMVIMKQKSNPPRLPHNKLTCLAEIIEIPAKKENSCKSVLSIKGYWADTKWIPKKIKALAYFEQSYSAENLQPGSQIVFNSYLNPTQNFGNPDEFNYKRYLAIHDIYYQTYIPGKSWRKTQKQPSASLIGFSNRLRLKLLKLLNKTGIEERNTGVASALLLGYKDYLSKETREKFSSSGAMHVLAVSGLHVGIVFLLFHYLLLFLEKIKYGKQLKIFLILIILWGYAILTGLSPSVTRATLMFSVIAIGSQLRRTSSVYNSLAFSAFILLYLNPMLLFSVSFQLSYTAVLSIVFFQPKLYRLISLPYLPDKLWQWFTVAVAAQIGTTPLVIHYFNQFPNYFWITNFIAIPAAAMVIITGFTTLITFPVFPGIGKMLGAVLNYILSALNYSVGFIEDLPYSVSGDLWIGKPHLIFIYLIIFLLSIFVVFKKNHHLKGALLLVILLLVFDILHKYSQRNRSELIIYNAPETTLINFIDGKQNYILTSRKDQKETIEFSAKSHWLNRRTDSPEYFSIGSGPEINTQTHSFFTKDHFIQFKTKKLFILSDSCCLINKVPMNKINIDYLVITQNCNIPFTALRNAFSFNKIILDASFSYYEKEKWIRLFKEEKIEFHSIADEGAFIKKLE